MLAIAENDCMLKKMVYDSSSDKRSKPTKDSSLDVT